MENPNEVKTNVEQKKAPSTGLKVTVLVILIALLVVGILLPIKLVPNAFSSLASSITSIFVSNKPATITTSKSDINSGDQFTITWTGDHKTNGTYAISYDCIQGLRLETSVNQPNDTIACGTTYYFSPNTNSIDVTVFSEAARYADIKLTIGFLENGAPSVTDIANTNITVTNSALPEGNAQVSTSTDSQAATSTPVEATTTPVTTKPVSTGTVHTTKNPAHPVSNPNGTADLEVRPIAVGYLSANGVFIPSSTINPDQQAAVRFSIINTGDKNTGPWTFSTTLPSQTDPSFVSATQQNLGPGDRIDYTLGFKNINNVKDNVVTISADPSNFLTEVSKANNIAQMHVVNTQGFAPIIIGTNTGNADLAVTILDTGTINRADNSYIPSNSVNSADRVGVRFQVVNLGAKETGSWTFHANLPSTDSRIANYTSSTEQSLLPNQKAIFTISFDNIQYQGNNTVSINVDPANQISESNETNNAASATVVRN